MGTPKIPSKNDALGDFLRALQNGVGAMLPHPQTSEERLEEEKKQIDAAVVRDREFSTGELDYEPD